MDNEIVTLEKLRVSLLKDLAEMTPVTSYSVKEIVTMNLDVIDQYINNGLNLKQACEKMNSYGTKMKYGTFQRAYKQIKDGKL